MISIKRLNCANTYRYDNGSTELLSASLPERSIFACNDGEVIIRKRQRFCRKRFDDIPLSVFDKAIIQEIGKSKYLTKRQIYLYLKLRGFDLTCDLLGSYINYLEANRMISEKTIIKNDSNLNNEKILYYQLDHYGNIYLKTENFILHKGLQYNSYKQKEVRGIDEDTPANVKKILAANQIIIGLLINGADIDRFGIMETFRIEKKEIISDSCIFRTAAYVKIDPENVLAYEVVRNTHESTKRVIDKVKRYYYLINNREYLLNNHHGDNCYPQLVICGENFTHNLMIKDALVKNGLWNEEMTILFSEDQLSIQGLKSIYSINDDGSTTWYDIPLKKMAA